MRIKHVAAFLCVGMMLCLTSTPFVSAETEQESDQMIRIVMLPLKRK